MDYLSIIAAIASLVALAIPETPEAPLARPVTGAPNVCYGMKIGDDGMPEVDRTVDKCARARTRGDG